MRKGAAGSFVVILSSASELPALLRMSLILEKPVGSHPMGFFV
jgi:hypothetical protein